MSGGAQQQQDGAHGVQEAGEAAHAVEDVQDAAEVDAGAKEQRHVLARRVIAACQQRQRPLHQLLHHRGRQRALPHAAHISAADLHDTEAWKRNFAINNAKCMPRGDADVQVQKKMAPEGRRDGCVSAHHALNGEGHRRQPKECEGEADEGVLVAR